MKTGSLISLALIVSALPAAALADDPRDPTMRNAAARAQDREDTRRLNLDALARVRARDARGTQGWRAADGTAGVEYASRSQDYRRAMSDYERNRAAYNRDMAEWRRGVAACRAGDYSACD